MSNHDPISDMLTRIRNASQKKHTTTTIPGSKMSLSIAKVLQKEGFISDINEEGEGYKSQIILGLKYSGKNKFPLFDLCKELVNLVWEFIKILEAYQKFLEVLELPSSQHLKVSWVIAMLGSKALAVKSSAMFIKEN